MKDRTVIIRSREKKEQTCYANTKSTPLLDMMNMIEM